MTVDTGRVQPDALSEVLETIRLRGDQIHRCEPVAPFAVAPAGDLRALYLVERGEVIIRLGETAATITLGVGDVALLPHGSAHSVESGSGAADRDHAARWLRGTFTLDEVPAARLLAVLPTAIELHQGPGARFEWLEVSGRLLGEEVTNPRPGSAVMVSRILDLLFVQILRAWAGSGVADGGWLAAAMDPQVGMALEAIHRDPERAWTVAALAHLATLSRSAFAERFTRLVGQTPGAYVTERRLDRATELLRHSSTPVGTIATLVGYESDAAFSRAFRKRFGTSPLRWRRTQSSDPER
ncbi:helix-turn-helix domain protein [Rhodococcus sp. MTM3W5.2]|uniref:AraC family transcriptional regulator n=1 Tax=Rhodococcus sp. MTM3W5.2 TaxID=1805827 RepID=UPI0009795489|nr:AraC family transcriptional regulator [Rhodococcus sp. MTM3W5.2]AQA21882.1 helix-turn-helix domain protein [Rhodococcus sp. MTM3W5.2]